MIDTNDSVTLALNCAAPELHDRVGWTLPDATEVFQSLQLIPERRPLHFNMLESEKARLVAAGWGDCDRRICVKYARVQTTKADIVTIMIYPTASPEILPIFAAEWVVVGEDCHVAVLDVESAGQQPKLQPALTAKFTGLGQECSAALQPAESRPAWFDEIAQPWAIFSSCPTSGLPIVRRAYQKYLAAALESFYQPRIEMARGGPDASDVATYKLHHCQNSPGQRFLERFFGQRFTSEFLHTWHFGPLAQLRNQG